MDIYSPRYSLPVITKVQDIDREILELCAEINQFKRKRDFLGLTDMDLERIKYIKTRLERLLAEKHYLGW